MGGRADVADAALVYCLSHSQDLADAAVALDLAQASAPGQLTIGPAGSATVVSIDQWRTERAADFDRACTALVRAQGPTALQPRPGPIETTTAMLLPVLAGALLTAAVSQWLDLRNRGRNLAATVTAAVTGYTAQARRFVAGDARWDAVVAASDQAKAALRPVAARRRAHSAAGDLLHLLTHPPLGVELGRGWSADADADERAELVREHLDLVDSEVHLLAMALATPGRPHPTLWTGRRRARTGVAG